LAAFTIASTASVVMSARIAAISGCMTPFSHPPGSGGQRTGTAPVGAQSAQLAAVATRRFGL
jgi:hypothetical protein